LPANPPRGVAPLSSARFAQAVLGYNLFVLLFGAVVRVTDSGAGCGEHWPTCHGELVHIPRTGSTAIEFTHRVTSGLALVAVVALYFVTLRRTALGHPARRLALGAVAFIVLEALIGAGLVLFGLVEKNASVARAVTMPAHLVVTFAFTAILTVLAVWRDPPPAATWKRHVPGLLLACAIGLVIVSAMGAVTALGDTVFPPETRALGERLAEDHGSGVHFLKRLRVVHPVLAVLVGALVVQAARRLAATSPSQRTKTAARAVVVLTLSQLALGLLNVFLSAPGWLQIAHLALALALWVAFVVLGYEFVLAREGASSGRA
jgi:heme A synthase